MIPYGRYCNKAMSICIYSIWLQARLDAHEYSEIFPSSKRLPLNLYKSLHLPLCDLVVDFASFELSHYRVAFDIFRRFQS
ncbi:hypothetical protein EYC84_005355 [Monilinia fructicola]|uniref:Uncharacterized protein n=1 Tax=Monilinia fructicola TaxID=38448 RepID=A0A5M9K036_MONFR|nr:hypothetical protein EYC84_005355 [Monilinia fructicola]